MGYGTDGIPKIRLDNAVIERARLAREAAIQAEKELKEAIRRRELQFDLYNELNNTVKEAEKKLEDTIREEQRLRDELIGAQKEVVRTNEEALKHAKKELRRWQKKIKNLKAKLDRANAKVEKYGTR